MPPLTPQEQVRQQVRRRLADQIAELLVQADKGSPSMKLSDLRSEESRRVYAADALMITDGDARFERVRRVHTNDAHLFALAEQEQRAVERQATDDIARCGAVIRRGNFGVVPAGRCYVCTDPIEPDTAAVLELSATLKVDVHGECCLHDPKFEMTAQFAFRVKGGHQ